MKKLWILFILVHAALFLGGTSRLPDNELRYLLSGRYIHFAAFAVVCMVTSLTAEEFNVPFPFLLSLAYTMALTVALEFIQSLGHRTFSEKDILWGVYGSLVGSMLIYIIKKKNLLPSKEDKSSDQ